MDVLKETKQLRVKHKFYFAIERSRYRILNNGYKLVAFKSNVKKSISTFRKQMLSFYF